MRFIRRRTATWLGAVAVAGGVVAAVPAPAVSATVTSTITIAAPTYAVPGDSFTISGSVNPGNATNTRQVVLKRRLENGTWQDPWKETTSSGSYSFQASIPAGDSSACFTTYVRQRTIPNGNSWTWATTAMTCVYDYPLVQSSITLGASTTTPAPGQVVTLAGTAAPANGSNPRQVVLKMQTPGQGDGWQDNVAEVTTNAGGGYSFQVTVPPGDNHRCYSTYVRKMRATGGSPWSFESSPALCLDQNNAMDAVSAVDTISPKIVETAGQSGPEASSGAAQLGRFTYSIGSGSRRVQLLGRAAGSGAAWAVAEDFGLRSGNGTLWPHELWGSQEYVVQVVEPTGASAYGPVSGVVGAAETFGDDFSGTQLSSAWSLKCSSGSQVDGSVPGDTCGHGHSFEHNSMSAVSLDGSGTADFKVLYDQTRNGGTCVSTTELKRQCYVLTGHVGTDPVVASPATDGKSVWIAARLKLHGLKGSHSAFWTQGGYGYDASGEDDIVEYFGSNATWNNAPAGTGPGAIAHNLYKDQDGDGDVEAGTDDKRQLFDAPSSLASYGSPADTAWDDSYHIFAVRWTTYDHTYWIDGKQVSPSIPSPRNGTPVELRLSNLVNNGENGDNTTVSYDAYPNRHTLKVDWVKVWRM